MGLTPTQKSIIGTFINGRNASDDFLQLATNNGGTVFAWIDSAGILRGTFATSVVAAGANTNVQFNNAGNLGGDSQFTWDNVNKRMIAGPAKSAFSVFGQGFLDTAADGAYSFRSLNDFTRIPALNIFKETTGGVFPGNYGLESDLNLTNPAPFAAGGEYGATFGAFTSGSTITSGVIGAIGASTQTNSNSNVAEFRTFDGDINHNGAGILSLARGVFSAIANQATGIITDSRCFDTTVVNNAGGSYGTIYGYRADTQGGLATTASYAFYSVDQGSGANDWSFYSVGGKNFLGGTGTTTALQLTNLTAATLPTSQSSPILTLQSNFWNGASAINGFTVQSVAGNGLNTGATLTFSYFGASGQTGGYSFDNKIVCGALNPSSFLINNNNFNGVVLTLTAAGNASAGKTTYTGAFTGQAFPQAGMTVTIAGFVNGANNGTFEVFSCNTTSLVVLNAGGVAETHAGTSTTKGSPSGGTLVSINPGSGTLSIQGTSFAVNSRIDSTPLSVGLVLTQQGDANDYGFLSPYSNTDTSRGFRVGASYDGTGANPGLLNWGLNAAGGHVLNLVMPDGITGLAATGTLFTSSSVGVVALQASTGTGTNKLTISGSTGAAFNCNVTVPTQTPASAAAAGIAGTITWDASFIYICTATNTWKRVGIATW